METNLLEALESVGYNGPLLDDNKLSHALELGPKSTEYTTLVAWLAEQIRTFIDVHETIHPTSTPDDASFFLLELSCFLKEIGCINENLTMGNVNQRLSTTKNKTLLLEILITELMSCKLLEIKDAHEESEPLVCIQSHTAACLRQICRILVLPTLPKDITIEEIFSILENKLKEVISKVSKDLLGHPLFYGKLSTEQWEKLSEYNEKLRTEYAIRGDMLITRLDVTLKSFLWSERCANEKALICIHRSLETFRKQPDVNIEDLLAARQDLAIMEKTSNGSVCRNTKSRLNKIIIGDVPDRGGRPYEQEPPPPEMPPWQKDRVARPQSSGGYGRGQNTRGSAGRGGGDSARGGRGGAGGGNYGNNAGYGVGGSSGGGGGYVNTESGTGYANARDGYSGNSNYSRGGGGGNNYGEAGGNYLGGRRGRINYNNSNYSGGAGYGNNRGRGNYYNSGGTSNRTSGAYQDYNAADNYGQDYQYSSARGGRVQGGWNQGGHNYQRDGYNRARGRGKRQY